MFVRTVYIYLIEETSLFLDIISLVFSYTIYNLQHSSLTTYLDFIWKGTVDCSSNNTNVACPIPLTPFCNQ